MYYIYFLYIYHIYDIYYLYIFHILYICIYVYTCMYVFKFPNNCESSIHDCRLDRIVIHQPSNFQSSVLKSKLHHDILRTNIL